MKKKKRKYDWPWSDLEDDRAVRYDTESPVNGLAERVRDYRHNPQDLVAYLEAEEFGRILRKIGPVQLPAEVWQYLCDTLEGKVSGPQGRPPRYSESEIDFARARYHSLLDEMRAHKRSKSLRSRLIEEGLDPDLTPSDAAVQIVLEECEWEMEISSFRTKILSSKVGSTKQE